jgi:hypothetical protein
MEEEGFGTLLLYIIPSLYYYYLKSYLIILPITVEVAILLGAKRPLHRK